MAVIQDLADKLAADVIAASKDLDDPRLIDEISQKLGDTSPTTQEAFLTSVRVRLAEARAREYLQARIAKAKSGSKAQGNR